MTHWLCTCESGRASDGSEHGPCAYCEDQFWKANNGLTDDDLEEMLESQPQERWPA